MTRDELKVVLDVLSQADRLSGPLDEGNLPLYSLSTALYRVKQEALPIVRRALAEQSPVRIKRFRKTEHVAREEAWAIWDVNERTYVGPMFNWTYYRRDDAVAAANAEGRPIVECLTHDPTYDPDCAEWVCADCGELVADPGPPVPAEVAS
jgi:hypothetical protein